MAASARERSSRVSRLTFGPGASRAPLSTTADIPTFSHPSSQSDTRRVKPLPKPIKDKPESQNNDKTKKSRKDTAWRAKKRLEKEEQERKKREDPLEEAEEGEYDHHGIWQEKAPQEDVPVEVPGPEGVEGLRSATSDASVIPAQPRVNPIDYWNGDEGDIAGELEKLQDMPSDHSFGRLFDSSQVGPDSQQPSEHVRDRPNDDEAVGATHDGAISGRTKRVNEASDDRWNQTVIPTAVRSAPTPRRGWQRCPTEDRRRVAEGSACDRGVMYSVDHRRSPDVPMPPSAQRQRSMSLPAQYQNSRLKYSTFGNDDTDDDEEDDQDDDGSRDLSPTELNSSAMRDPVNRPTTRRSNSHRQVYSRALPDEDESTSSVNRRPSAATSHQHQDVVADSLLVDGRPSAFAVSQTELPSQRSTQLDPAPAARARTIATYSKSRPRVSASSRATRQDATSRRGFRDQFSPELEWEEQQRRQRRELERAGSKRHGSTSFWPGADASSDTSTTSTVYVDDAWRHDYPGQNGSEEDDEEEGNMPERRPLGEVRVKGRIIARSRGRNGAWPEHRDLGLFGNDSQEARRRETQPLRPVSERLHLVKQEEGDDEARHPRRHTKEKIKAFPNLYQKHPPAKLKLKPDRSFVNDTDGYGHRSTARERYDRLPYTPGFNTTGKGSRKRKNELNDLPDYVLKPIDKISIDEYKRQQRERVPGDGLVNPQLIKSGRLASRDNLLRPQKRIKKSKNGGRADIGFDRQTQIRGDDDEPDPIVPPTQTQRDSSHGTTGLRFNGRRDRNRRPTKRITSGGGSRLKFTSTSPRSDRENDRSRSTALPFTARVPTPPLVSERGQVVHDTYDVPGEDTRPRPAEEIPELAQPRVSFIRRFKRKQPSDESNIEGREGPNNDQAGERQGYLRKVSGRWIAPAADQNEWTMNGGPLAMNPGVDALLPSSSQDRSDPRPNGETDDNTKDRQTPLFLPKDEELDSTLSHRPAAEASTSTVRPLSNRMSGAQLCDDLLQRVNLKDIPIIPHAKSSREAKRDEMAKRVAQKSVYGSTHHAPSRSFATQAMNAGASTDNADHTSYEPRPSQIRRMEHFAMMMASDAPAESDSPTGVGANTDNDSGRKRSTQTQPTQASRHVSATKSSAQSSNQGPPGNQQALKEQNRKTSRTRSAFIRGFQAPKPIRKPETPTLQSTPSASRVPRWATDN